MTQNSDLSPAGLLASYLVHSGYTASTVGTLTPSLTALRLFVAACKSDGTFPDSKRDLITDLDIDSLVAHLAEFAVCDLLDRQTGQNSGRPAVVLEAISSLEQFIERSEEFFPDLASFLKPALPGTAEFRALKIARHQKQQPFQEDLGRFVFYSGQAESDLLVSLARNCAQFFALEAANRLRFLTEERTIFEAKLVEPKTDREAETSQKPFMVKINDERDLAALVTRESIRRSVFRPDVALPTMSLAEFAASEMAQIERQQKAASYAKFVGDYEKSQIGHYTHARVEEEEAEDKARAWDDWKDLNPRGSGNRGGNRG